MFKKIVSLCLVICVMCAFLAGCGGDKNTADDGTVTITIGSWPKKTNEKLYAQYEEYVKKMNDLYPNIKIVKDEWGFDLQTYMVKATAGDLPNVFTMAPTELNNFVKSGYAKDVTGFAEEYGYADAFTDKYSRMYMVDDKFYGIPYPDSIYQMGVACNVELFKKAGLTDESGNLIYPETWEGFGKTAQIIKEKTGYPGYEIISMDTHGGWIFMNTAMSYGAEFMKKENEKWVATFASEECAEAMQVIKDLKWKYDGLQPNVLTGLNDAWSTFGSGQAGMLIASVDMIKNFPTKYGISKDNIAMCRMPAGSEGRYSLSSSEIAIISNNTTDEQADAIFKWFEVIGISPNVNDATKASLEEKYKTQNEIGNIVGVKTAQLWKNEDRIKVEDEVLNKYKNVDVSKFADYTSGEDITYMFEPERCVQQLYVVLSNAIQEVLLNKDANIDEVLKKAQNDFQVNHLDKESN